MDSIVHAALEEVCSHGAAGLAVAAMWPSLHSPLSSRGLRLCDGVKAALWTNLLNIPGLRFEAHGVSYDPGDPKIQSIDESERLELKIVAAEHLCNNFVGVYDIKASDAGISQTQRRALERLAIARTNGITQHELAKEFGMKGNNIFYVLRNLECRGLIVRQSTIVRTKEASNEGEPKNSSIVNTNMLHLYRYAKHLGCQQRLEITKGDKTLADNENADVNAVSGDGDGAAEGSSKEHVHVKDYLPALKAICDKLEQADGKILVVADIKRDLGYRGSPGHRAWRNICNRLKDARVVEEFCAKVNKKEVSCLRLLKSFSPKNFEPKTLGCGDDDLDAEQLVKLGKRGQISDQLLELPIEHQIYEMVDAEGSKGLTITEVCKRLGINNKRYYTRLLNMFSRFGMHLQAESHNRGVAYRVWTSGNFNPEASNIVVSKPESALCENDTSNPPVGYLAWHEKSAQTIPDLDLWTSKVDVPDNEKSQDKVIELELPNGSPSDELLVVSTAAVSTVAALETSRLDLSTPPRQRSYQKYPCLTLTVDSARREQWILQRLQEEKFIIKAELRRELESLEKDKQTVMDRKTLDRSLNKLQQEGLCKCIRVSVPVVSNCGRSRTTEVVLQPSIHVCPEVLGQIHEKLRSFDIEIRAQCSSRLKKGQSVPELDGIQRILKSAKLDDQAEKSEAMRANGFVLAKMVRTKLLHIHLWRFLIGSPGWDDTLLSGKNGYDLNNPHSTCKLFALDASIKAMPLELFLQVVGSTQKFEDMLEKCRSGLCLSNLPEKEYKQLMDTRATGRLSWIVDILRRLKLIRLIKDGLSEDIANIPHATLTYALELKPYIEEPVSIITPSSGVISFDLRPQIRHDFILSSRKALDEYWSTLEYSYAAADSKAALHAFPGSAVPEVFLSRTWASVRVMTADQRAELLKRVVNDDPNKKLSFKECEKIAKDLNLTLEQVLRIYYDKRQKRLTRFQGVVDARGEEFHLSKKGRVSSSRKRKRSSDVRSSMHTKVGTIDGHSSSQRLTDCQSLEENNFCSTSLGEQDTHLPTSQEEDHTEAIEEVESIEEPDGQSFIHECALSRMKPTRQKKFSWTEKTERQLVIEYVRYRAALGAKFHRTDWSSLPDLPAPPDACKRRMALLNSDLKFRKAVMRLCNLLSERYAKHLDKLQNKSLNSGDCSVLVRDSLVGKDCQRNFSCDVEDNEDLGSEERWDDFDETNIKIALDEVLRYKWIAKLDASKRVGSIAEKWSDLNMDTEEHDQLGTELVSPFTSSEEIHNRGGGNNVRPLRSSCHRLPRKYSKLLNEGIRISRWAHESLAVSNAAELFKLVFLSTSTAPEVPNLLAETLRRYSEHDLFAAFNFLRESKIMVGGSGGNPFVLSQQFLHSISSSPFPTNTGKRAAKFASWLHDKEKDLMEEGIDLTEDLQCGDIFHLCGLVFSGELLISPSLPDEGVGEAEDSRTLKRKSDSNEFCSGDKAKKLKSSLAGDNEIISRREKGFPGIRLSISRATISRTDAIELFKGGSIHNGVPYFGEIDRVHKSSSIDIDGIAFPSDHVNEALRDWSSIPKAIAASESEWETMASYAERIMSLPTSQQQAHPFNPELFRDVHLAILMAGDQGLSMEEVSKLINVEGENVPEIIVEVLEVFGRALKVNAYDSVHVVDSLYRSKYFLTSRTNLNQDLEVSLPTHSKNDDGHLNHGANAPKDLSTNPDEVHKVTILNLSEEVYQPSNEMQSGKKVEGCKQAILVSPGSDHESKTFEFCSGAFNLCRPILPWINGDGRINMIVYKGLVRRILGIVMQNPGILEDDIVSRMSVLNPQSCRTLLKLMIMDNHIFVRKMHQTTYGGPPAILGSLLGSSFKKSKLIFHEHFFANPMCTTLL
ncbi:uncharacterized protein LOC130787950 isoform X1 [Actinidia eriantha]|uniref:uncharacterized protein LOC130787950 isoform X1 n=1 Tax=Actinidia eriantha TaxID=165200 RepID=UPI002585F4A1|nr:uncharacterized protein LOC130787950 isoform X1 [Actinidia eriantha]